MSIPSQPDRTDIFSAIGGAELSASDTAIDYSSRSLYPRAASKVEAGTIRITTMDGSVIDFLDAEWAVGDWKPLAVKIFHDTGSTATKLKVYW